jgi:hypothetical protein
MHRRSADSEDTSVGGGISSPLGRDYPQFDQSISIPGDDCLGKAARELRSMGGQPKRYPARPRHHRTVRGTHRFRIHEDGKSNQTPARSRRHSRTGPDSTVHGAGLNIVLAKGTVKHLPESESGRSRPPWPSSFLSVISVISLGVPEMVTGGHPGNHLVNPCAPRRIIMKVHPAEIGTCKIRSPCLETKSAKELQMI